MPDLWCPQHQRTRWCYHNGVSVDFIRPGKPVHAVEESEHYRRAALLALVPNLGGNDEVATLDSVPVSGS